MKRVLLILLLMHHMCMAQIPVELFTGHERATFDVLFFKNFLTKEEKKSYCLFFNRNRLSVDYRITSTNYLPSFGATEAISYNDPKWKGWAPVAVVQIFNNGVFPKAGGSVPHGILDCGIPEFFRYCRLLWMAGFVPGKVLHIFSGEVGDFHRAAAAGGGHLGPGPARRGSRLILPGGAASFSPGGRGPAPLPLYGPLRRQPLDAVQQDRKSVV